jgi:iron complex outermembrane receptor protein
MNGFTNNAPVKQPDGSTTSFKPSQADQWEGGVKVNLYEDKLTGSLSYYDISVKNVLRQDYPSRPDFTVQDGDQYSKGIEAQITANPFTGFNAIAGYAYNESKYEKVSKTIDGYRPSSAGPANMANLWLSYRLYKGLLRGMGIGFGGNYAGKNGVIVDQTDSYYLPAFTVLNASLSYTRAHYSLILKLDNLANETYWVGWGTTIPQMPRRFSASFSVNF